MNVTDRIREAARRQPDALAYTGVPNHLQLTYGDLDRLIDGFAARTLDAGVQPRQTVIVDLREEIAYLVAAFALMRIGIAVAPPTLAEGFASARIAAEPDAGSALRNIVVTDQWLAVDAGSAPSACANDGAAVAVIFGTSGTTGTRRHYPITHAMLMRRVAIAGELMPLPPQPRVMVRVGLRTSFGFLMTLRAWHAGALTAFPRYDEVVLAMRGRGINVLFMSPANLATFLERLPAGEHLPALERIYLAGSAAPSLLIEEARERLCRDVRTLYGATEVGPVACAAREALGETPNAVGIVSRDVEVRCIDEQGSPQPHGIEGIVRVRRNPGSGGYLDAASEPAFSGDWFYPGDIGSLSADGVLCLTGRTNEIVNVGGDKRSLPAIEEAVRALGERLEVAAFVIAGELGVPQLNVAVVEAPGLDIPALGTRCVDSGAVPPRTRFIGVAALPRNEFGKVMRDALAAAHGAGSGA